MPPSPTGVSRRTLVSLGAVGAVAAVAPTAFGSRPALASGTVDVTSHGADPTGAADSTAGIMAADAAARAVGDTVWFPAGTYSAYGLRPSVSWSGAPGSVIVNRAPASDKFGFVRISSRTGLSFSGLVLDGAVSPDPATWSSATINTFTGAIPCFVENSTQLSFTNCTFRNGVRSGLRLHDCSDVTITDCSFSHVRDPWGDGTYVAGCTGVTYLNCTASDHTRIGFVADASVGVGNSGISYQGCDSSNGHHASILYGGGEYNAGFWTENSTGTTYDTCTATTQTHYGFNLQTGDKAPGAGAVIASATDCSVTHCGTGVKVGSFGTRALSATITRTTTTLAATAGTLAGTTATLRHSTDVVQLLDCESTLDSGTVASTTACHLRIDDGGTGSSGQVTLDGCRLQWSGTAPRPQDVLVTGSSQVALNLADVTCAPYGCVDVDSVSPASPTTTASGTTVLC